MKWFYHIRNSFYPAKPQGKFVDGFVDGFADEILK